jgi:hypothetical protein
MLPRVIALFSATTIYSIYTRNIMALLELNDDSRLYLQTIFDYFRGLGEWPTHRYLEQRFFLMHPNLDIVEVVQSLPSGFTNPVNLGIADSKATLTVSAIYQIWGSAQELDDYIQVIELCVSTYFHSSDGKPRITSKDIAQIYPLWHEWAIRKVGLLLEQETLIWSSIAGPDNEGGWSCEIKPDVRRFRGVKTIDQYLDKRDQPKKASATPMMFSDTLRLLIGHLYSKAIHPEKKDIEAGITRWEQDLTKPAVGDGGKLEVALLNALTRLGIPTLFSGRGKQGGTEKYAYDLIALGLFERRSPTAILISCKSSYNQPNLGEIGKLSDAVEQVKKLIGPDWSVFGALAVLGNPSLGIFTKQHDYRLWKKPHLQAILYAHSTESLGHMLWTHPGNWHPDSEKMWRSIYASSHKDLPEEILKEITTL